MDWLLLANPMIHMVVKFFPMPSAHYRLASGTSFKVAMAFFLISLAIVHAHNALGFAFPNIRSLFRTIFAVTRGAITMINNLVVVMGVGGMDRVVIVVGDRPVRLVGIQH